MTTVPDRIYRHEFKGWGDFLGTGRKPKARSPNPAAVTKIY